MFIDRAEWGVEWNDFYDEKAVQLMAAAAVVTDQVEGYTSVALSPFQIMVI